MQYAVHNQLIHLLRKQTNRMNCKKDFFYQWRSLISTYQLIFFLFNKILKGIGILFADTKSYFRGLQM